MKIAVIYARYSSENQTEQSIEGQIRVCTEYAKNNGIVIADTYIDRAMTGTNDNRPDFQRMMQNCKERQWDIILVYKFDRFSRNKYETAIHKKTLSDNGIKLVSATEYLPDTPERIIMESMFEAYAEYYSAELSQKVKRGMRESRLKGNFTGGNVMYGFKIVDKKVTINEPEAAIVRKMYEEYAGGKTVKEILDWLHEEGILYRGKPFARSTAYQILKNEKYVGRYHFNGEIFTNIYPKIVSEDIFEIVQIKAAENQYGTHDPDVIYLLKNKVKCGYCGKSIASDAGTSASGAVKRYYKCTGRRMKNGCKKQTVQKEALESLVLDVTLEVLNNSDMLSNLADDILEANKKRTKDTSVLEILVKQKEEIQHSIDNLLSCMEKGIITSSTKTRLEKLEIQLNELEGKIVAETCKETTTITKHGILKYFNKALKKEPRQLLNMLIKKVILFDDRIDIYYKYTTKSPDGDDHQGFVFYSDTVKMKIKNGTLHSLYIMIDMEVYLHI